MYDVTHKQKKKRKKKLNRQHKQTIKTEESNTIRRGNQAGSDINLIFIAASLQ